MIQFLSINFFFWISSIFVGFFRSSRFFCHPVYNVNMYVVRLLVWTTNCTRRSAVRTTKLYRITQCTFQNKNCTALCLTVILSEVEIFTGSNV